MKNFKPLELEDQALIKRYFDSLSDGISEYNFNLLYMWQNVYKPSYCVDEDILFILESYRKQLYSLMPICSEDKYIVAFQQVYDYIKMQQDEFEMYCVEQKFAETIKAHYGDKFDIYESRDDADYVYDANKLRELKGRKYNKKRNHLNAFLKNYEGRYEYKSLTRHDFPDCCRLLKEWRKEKQESAYDSIQGEILGIKSLFEQQQKLDIKIGGIYIDGILEAFAIGSILNKEKNMVGIHVEKANHLIRGLYVAINKIFLLEEFPQAVLVNREEDLGDEGLRKAKLSYYPTEMVPKYTIIEKSR